REPPETGRDVTRSERVEVRLPPRGSEGVPERVRRPRPSRGAADGRVRGRLGQGARPAAGRGRVVPTAGQRGRRRRALGRAVRRRRPRRSGGRAGRGRPRRGKRRFARSAQGRPHAAGLPAPPWNGAQTAASLTGGDSTLARVRGTIYALANQKGGVGKTTTAVNLAACLARAGERSLVVDLDPHANATSGLGEQANGASTYELLDGAPLDALVRSTRFANLDLLPARPDLAGAQIELARREDGERLLVESLNGVGGRYSFVFLDCPPSLGPLTVNALAAADRVLVPVQAEYYALEGLAHLLQTVDLIRSRLNPRLAVAGILLTMVDGRTRLASDVVGEVRRHFGPLVFTTTVPRSVRLAEAPSHGLPAIEHDRSSPGSEAYWKGAMEPGGRR